MLKSLKEFDDVRIEVARLRTVSEMQHLVADTILDRRIVAPATAGKENEAPKAEDESGCPASH